MSFKEKSTWIMALVTAGAYVAYLTIILGRAEMSLVTEVSYVATLLLTIGAVIVAAIVAHIAVAIVSHRDIEEEDQRDREIDRFGEYFGQWPVAVGSMAALGMAMLELNHFWIANVIYLAFVLSTLIGSAAKIIAYRRGFQQW